MSEQTAIELEDMEIGHCAEAVRVVTEEDLELFAKVSGDYNPVHMDEEFARKTPFRGRIAHGALIASFISGVLGNQLPGPGAIFLGLNMRFALPTRIGDEVTTRVTVKSVDLKSRKAVMDCVCMAEGKELMRAEAEVMVRKRRKKKDA
ncbi:MAG: MaoC family dehydratase [Maricaulis sp.]|jgi:3-hydroxybutyryl-CoA dehydratase|uniref:MaoC family dehydratase n=1 Tax=Maricaulis sp. TaxID=1486257 RepID=UPI001AFECE8E|nr:MaoC family dehydratase [Maricaulis sp.]MBO6730149.1 MaoC family dehydratase [Maricaulis sp.]MBO6848432.1 MaoC family dehydratase [Maricaulis sp.]MBO6878406.1 MaoC family dehydratase [Maricaulis sp.]MDM7983868.1 MaoC family dehydratase [Maricaulis sp.]